MNTKIKVPDGVSGNWKVETITINRDVALLSVINIPERQIKEGKYKKLSYRGNTVMSNTPAEIRDHYEYMGALQRGGHVLINGLGLGMTLQWAIEDKRVKKVTVIELNKDVIKLVAPTYKHKKVEIIHHDAYTYKPPKGIRYNVVWHDIWNDIYTENLPLMAKLHRKYGRRCDWQGSWSKRDCLRQRREENKYHAYFDYCTG